MTENPRQAFPWAPTLHFPLPSGEDNLFIHEHTQAPARRPAPIHLTSNYSRNFINAAGTRQLSNGPCWWAQAPLFPERCVALGGLSACAQSCEIHLHPKWPAEQVKIPREGTAPPGAPTTWPHTERSSEGLGVWGAAWGTSKVQGGREGRRRPWRVAG